MKIIEKYDLKDGFYVVIVEQVINKQYIYIVGLSSFTEPSVPTIEEWYETLNSMKIDLPIEFDSFSEAEEEYERLIAESIENYED